MKMKSVNELKIQSRLGEKIIKEVILYSFLIIYIKEIPLIAIRTGCSRPELEWPLQKGDN